MLYLHSPILRNHFPCAQKKKPVKTFLVYSTHNQIPKQDPARFKHTWPFLMHVYILKSSYDLVMHSFQIMVALEMLAALIADWNKIGSASSTP